MSYLKTKEVAQILRVSLPTVRRLVERGKLQAVAIGGQLRIDTAVLAAYLKQSQTKNESVAVPTEMLSV